MQNGFCNRRQNFYNKIEIKMFWFQTSTVLNYQNVASVSIISFCKIKSYSKKK